MISCTEFIPMYSELFKYLESKGGLSAVEKYWEHISDNYIFPRLGKDVEKSGMKGCYDYWAKALNEEAAGFTMSYDKKTQKFKIIMHYCPSRGMLNALTYMDPYHNYCEHCSFIYPRILEKYGIILKKKNFKEIEKAKCSFEYVKIQNCRNV